MQLGDDSNGGHIVLIDSENGVKNLDCWMQLSSALGARIDCLKRNSGVPECCVRVHSAEKLLQEKREAKRSPDPKREAKNNHAVLAHENERVRTLPACVHSSCSAETVQIEEKREANTNSPKQATYKWGPTRLLHGSIVARLQMDDLLSSQLIVACSSSFINSA
eukprot:scaffold2619_cov129-Skeletonema_dohrnii-CCMP3373.AAC.5